MIENARPFHKQIAVARKARKQFCFHLINLYVVFALFGKVFRFGDEETSLGLTSIIFLMIIGMTIHISIFELVKRKIWILFVTLVVWITLASLMNSTNADFKGLFALCLYLLFSVGVSVLDWNTLRLDKLFIAIITTVFVVSVFTLIDFIGIIDIPGFNENLIGMSIDNETRITGASGPFIRRSSMATYYGLFLPIIFIYGLTTKLKSMKVLAVVAFITGLLAILITFNRSAPFSVSIVLLLYLIANLKTTKPYVKMIVYILIIFSVTYGIFVAIMPNQLNAYKYKTLITFGIGDYVTKHYLEQFESDISRFTLFMVALKKIGENPIGYGLGDIRIDEFGYGINPHNNVTQLLWAAGIFGIFWLFLASIIFIKIFLLNKCNKSTYGYFTCLIYGFLGWFLVSLTHTNWSTGVVWLTLGILVSICNNILNESCFIINRIDKKKE